MDKKEPDSLIFFQSCNAEDGLWTQGADSYSGLWRINRKTGQADYMCDIFGHGYFIGTFECDNKIYMVPGFLSDEWLVYDKTEKTGEYKKLTPSINIGGSRTIKIDDTIWVIPQFSCAAIVSINLHSFHYEMVDGWTAQINNRVYEIISHVSTDGKRLFFSMQDFDKFVELNTESKHITWHDSFKGKNIRDICFGDGRIWMLPNEGSEIYCKDMFTGNVEKVVLPDLDARKFFFIIYREDKVFLMPFMGNPVMVYFENKWHVLDYPADFQEYPPACFWDYGVDKGKLILYPCCCNMLLEIDIETLTLVGRKIEPLVNWGEEERQIRCERNTLLNGQNFYEKNKYSLKAYLQLIKMEIVQF